MLTGEEDTKPKWDGPVDADGLPHGSGTMAYPPPAAAEEDEEEKPGDTFIGMMHGRRQGQGKYTWASAGASYQGDYVDGRKQGHGVMVFPDMSRFEGSWVADRMEGEGTCSYPSGDLYTGGWKAGQKHGEGMYHFRAHACQFLGLWHEGSFVEGKWVHRDGTTFQGSFENSVPSEGTFYFSSSGLLQEGKYEPKAGWRGGVVAAAAATAATAATAALVPQAAAVAAAAEAKAVTA